MTGEFLEEAMPAVSGGWSGGTEAWGAKHPQGRCLNAGETWLGPGVFGARRAGAKRQPRARLWTFFKIFIFLRVFLLFK